MAIDSTDRHYLNLLRGAAMVVVMLMHLGLSWFYLPYSQYTGVVVPLFFFVSGAAAFNSLRASPDRPYYFLNRYLSLIIPFLIFGLPFFALLFFSDKSWSLYEGVKWLIAWPSRGVFPFDMRQLWFICALILMFIVSYPILKLAVKKLNVLIAAFGVSLIYVVAAEQWNWVSIYYDIDLLDKLDLPMQVHQVFALFNFYLFGALIYQLPSIKVKTWFLVLIPVISVAIYFHFEIRSFSNLKVLFFERGIYFTLISYVFILAILLGKRAILALVVKFSWLEKLLLNASKHSYSLFLVHTPMIFIFERHLGLNELSGQVQLALIKMAGVVALSFLVAPYLTFFTNRVVKALTIKPAQAQGSVHA